MNMIQTSTYSDRDDVASDFLFTFKQKSIFIEGIEECYVCCLTVQ